jgi:hypothetical protein
MLVYFEYLFTIKKNTNIQKQIIFLWNKFKSDTKPEELNYRKDEIEKLLLQWNLYREKIISGTLTLDEYTNILIM